MAWVKVRFKVWTDRDAWSPEMAAYEWSEPVRGLVLIAHHQFMWERTPVRGATMWFISEKSTGLRITDTLCSTRGEALDLAILTLNKYDEDRLHKTVERNIIKQVVQQIGA